MSDSPASSVDPAAGGPVSIVTGAAVRIGRSIALKLASQGHRVAIHFNTSVAEADQTCRDALAAGAPEAVAIQAELSDPDDCRLLIAQARQRLGQPTVLVNSAAIFEGGSLASTDADNWQRHLDINLAAPLWLTQAFCRDCDVRQNVVNIVDWRGRRPPAGHLAYTVSKAGLVTMTELLAQELAPRVRVNGIAPGPMLPPPGADEAYLREVAATIPLRRSGDGDDIADAVAYLLDADFVTGHILHVTGGQEFSGRAEG